MEIVPGGVNVWLRVAWWVGGAVLLGLALWTLVRAPGKSQDPGRK
jgi:hypothetical protein